MTTTTKMMTNNNINGNINNNNIQHTHTHSAPIHQSKPQWTDLLIHSYMQNHRYRC